MLRLRKIAHRLLSFVLVGILATTGTALAEKPSGNDGGKHEQQEKHSGKEAGEASHSEAHHGDDLRGHAYFSDNHRDVIQKYYAEQYRSGKCPPGLAKKHNGCMPPGQAKKWKTGRVLPRDVIFYDLPHAVTVQLGSPPAGHRFVRVASDILLMAIGTGIVVDAIEFR